LLINDFSIACVLSTDFFPIKVKRKEMSRKIIFTFEQTMKSNKKVENLKEIVVLYGRN